MGSPYKTFAIKTFGCKVNFADSSTISRNLVDYGLSCIDFNEIADIYIINTCSVTENADKKANHCIKQLFSKAPSSKIILTGCYAQLDPQNIIKKNGVDTVIGMEEKLNIEKYLTNNNQDIITNDIRKIKNFNITYSLSERTRSFVKIQDGCDYNCTYCTIPNARGKSRSSSIIKTIKSIDCILEKGIQEIVLSGINVGDFGIKNESLYQLLFELEKKEKLKRYRISSIEPNLLNDKIIRLVSNSNKCLPHFHIPLQSGSDKILRDMKRRYNVEDYINLITKINYSIPNICIGVDVIVGFPSETKYDFEQTYTLLEKLNVSYLHVFSYSKRYNTEAVHFRSLINKKDVLDRRRKLQILSNKKFKNYIDSNIGKEFYVLFEKYENGLLEGLTENYIRVHVNSKVNYKNKIKKVKIIKNDEFVFGELIE